ncbi:dihydrofolate reductase family protein [Acinetobacter larvae]|uniref:Bacterial bifunctional deaminase-reductase C-terminal domain-containing protein n=1 Tax=Acinetobacter larvae TaxID=1789224 RepID=A0A1B2M299_9GAMM|nr:dihydrofolate reductase family protein [Acinetobacter larvae]AOA59314.1 hypothetical protein BFG52_13750 [Acinetobacter larvae]
MSLQIIGYIATSADGYIATEDGRFDFLTAYQHIDCGYDAFIQDIDIIVMGRKTYEVICAFGEAWPYPHQKGFIVSSQADLPLVHPSLQLWQHSPAALVDMLKQQYHGRVWVVGGTQLQNTFIENNLLNRLEIYEMPVLLGAGIPLFPQNKIQAVALKSIQAEMIANTIIKKTYLF